jgi:glutamate/tyrosine decarboxylase-like PLP-dependent enzyme
MSNKRQTAVDWLVEQYTQGNYSWEAYDQAKEMEKEQLHKCASFWNGEEVNKPIFNEYYTETFNTPHP